MIIPSRFKDYRWWKDCCVHGQVRFLHGYVRFPRCDDETKRAYVDVTVVIFGPDIVPGSAGPPIIEAMVKAVKDADVNQGKQPEEKQISQATLPMKAIYINTVTEGDCRDLIPSLPDASINLCLCSPPYAERRNRHYPGVPAEQYADFTVQWMAKLWDKLADDGSVLIVIDPHVKDGSMADYVLRTQLALREAGWKQPPPRIWLKRDRGPIGRRDWPRHVYEEILWFTKTANPHRSSHDEQLRSLQMDERRQAGEERHCPSDRRD